jgi:hypothetical protein
MAASSTHTSDLAGSAQTAMASGACRRKAEPCVLAAASASMVVRSWTTTNSQGLMPLDEKERTAASTSRSSCSGATGWSVNRRMLRRLRSRSMNMKGLLAGCG